VQKLILHALILPFSPIPPIDRDKPIFLSYSMELLLLLLMYGFFASHTHTRFSISSLASSRHCAIAGLVCTYRATKFYINESSLSHPRREETDQKAIGRAHFIAISNLISKKWYLYHHHHHQQFSDHRERKREKENKYELPVQT
jgi:hypothetical protein